MPTQAHTINDILPTLRTLQSVISRQYRAEIIGIFGSYARGEARQDSDLDLLVRFFEGASLFDFTGLADFLEEQMHLKVDLVSERALREELKAPILQEVVPI